MLPVARLTRQLGQLFLTASFVLIASAAHAGLSAGALERVGVSLPPNAQLPLRLSLIDEDGARITLAEAMQDRPSLLILADYGCVNLCGPALALAIGSLERSALKPDVDYRLIAIGIDAKAETDKAREMKRRQVQGNEQLARAAAFLTADGAVLEEITAALGYRFAYDEANHQFAHPAAAFALTANGRVTRALSGLGLNPTDLELALVEAGEGRTGSFVNRAMLLCYGFDPAASIYTLSIHRLLALLSLLSVCVLALAIGIMRRGERHAP